MYFLSGDRTDWDTLGGMNLGHEGMCHVWCWVLWAPIKLRNCRFSSVSVIFYSNLSSLIHTHAQTHWYSSSYFISLEAAPGNVVSTGGFYLDRNKTDEISCSQMSWLWQEWHCVKHLFYRYGHGLSRWLRINQGITVLLLKDKARFFFVYICLSFTIKTLFLSHILHNYYF